MVFDINHIIGGFFNVLQPYNMLICIAGLFIGVLIGALPGLTATMGVAVCVPFSYVMEPEQALLLMSAVFCGGVYGGLIPAILLGIPGTPASAPTAFEGRALTQAGESGRALMAGTVGATLKKVTGKPLKKCRFSQSLSHCRIASPCARLDSLLYDA